MEQVLDTMASDPCRDPELGKMGADRIDHGGLLPDEEMARAVEHQAALLLGRLGLRWSIRQLCCSGVLVSTNRMFVLVTASQIASASAASFLCRFTCGLT